MTEWLYESGIGEARAALVRDQQIVEAHLYPDDEHLRAGTICDARLTDIIIPGQRGIVSCDGGAALLEPLPKRLTQGAQLLVEIVREAIPEPSAVKRAKARVAPLGSTAVMGATLIDRINATGIPVRILTAYDPDALEAAGWSEVLESAARGIVAFEGGTLRISLTPAMTLIDVDGHLPPTALAIAAARAAAATIRRFNLVGSIGIDFPTLSNKAERLATADAFDAVLPLPFERTSINGFGFLQIIRPRARASLSEQVQYDRVAAAARALLRRAERSGIIGAVRLTAHPQVIARIATRPDWIERLSAHFGGTCVLHGDAGLAIDASYVAKSS